MKPSSGSVWTATGQRSDKFASFRDITIYNFFSCTKLFCECLLVLRSAHSEKQKGHSSVPILAFTRNLLNSSFQKNHILFFVFCLKTKLHNKKSTKTTQSETKIKSWLVYFLHVIKPGTLRNAGPRYLIQPALMKLQPTPLRLFYQMHDSISFFCFITALPQHFIQSFHE